MRVSCCVPPCCCSSVTWHRDAHTNYCPLFRARACVASASTAGADDEQVQITLVDCPGHATLIRTVIGGAHIIDLALLVVDVTKGMQTQTAECFVLCEIMCDRMIVVLNKTDLLDAASRTERVAKVRDARSG